MPSLNIAAKGIKGLLPALDRRNIGQPFVVDGQNFLIDLKGPYAAFANRIFTYNQWFNPVYTQSFELDGGDAVYCTLGAIFRFDVVTQRLQLLFSFIDAGIVYRWTMANVNGVYYFARSGINGVIVYNPLTSSWSLMTANVPFNPISVGQGSGRLVIISATFAVWSALGDGTNLTPDLTTGAGFQPLSLMGGTGIMCGETADGFMVWTTKGTMKCEYVYFLNTFRIYPLDRSYTPINCFCVVPIEPGKEWLILDEKGFYSSTGQQYKEFEPIMGEYFNNTLLPTLDLTNVQQVRMEYNQVLKNLYVSIASPLLNGQYAYAYVLYRSAAEWGIFNYFHYNFMEMAALSGVNKGYNWGFLGADLYFHYFVPDVFVELAPTGTPIIYFYRMDLDTPIRIVNGILIATADMHIHNEDETVYNTAGLYQYNGANASTVYLAPDNPLNSYIEVGLLRWAEQKYDDEIGEVTNVKLSVDDFPGTQIQIDYNNVPVGITIDYNNVPVEIDQDWGSGVLSSSIFNAIIIGTNDGTEPWIGNTETLTLSADEGNDKYFTCFNSGVFHIIRIEALVANTTFHLRLMELSGSVGGRI